MNYMRWQDWTDALCSLYRVGQLQFSFRGICWKVENPGISPCGAAFAFHMGFEPLQHRYIQGLCYTRRRSVAAAAG
jgi:hypothetical protein